MLILNVSACTSILVCTDIDIETFNLTAYFNLYSLPTLTMLVKSALLDNENDPENKTLHATLGNMVSRRNENDYLALGKGTYITSKVTIYHPWQSDLDFQLQPPVSHTTSR
jgi:hypothetical protein